MKVKCIKKLPYGLRFEQIYDVISEENGFYRVIDDSGEDYLYAKSLFEIIEK